MLGTLPVVAFDGEAATIYGQIVARQGFSRLRTLDRMIAATALQLDATVVTANPSDFADVPGLRLIAW